MNIHIFNNIRLRSEIEPQSFPWKEVCLLVFAAQIYDLICENRLQFMLDFIRSYSKLPVYSHR